VASLLTGLEAVLVAEQPLVVMSAGDSNAALACGLVAAKLGVAVVHAEAGLRSWEWSTAEEINRVVSDRLSDTLLTSSPEARQNLLDEGVPDGRIHPVGTTLADALRSLEPEARSRRAWLAHDLPEGRYVLVTLHAAANVAERERLGDILAAVGELARHAPVLFLVHPRAERTLDALGGRLTLATAGVRCVDAVGYTDFISLALGAGAVVTDSGTVQDEASALGVACFTLGETTARPATLTHGTNVLLGAAAVLIAHARPRTGPHAACTIPLWDGHAAERIADALVANYTLAASGVKA
jgi:UDP-N-acetylglucosamine 2-epimerase (non-hydrolysing)